MRKPQNFQWKEITMGTCYYPEHWSRELWQDDLQRMKAVGITVIRVAEFAWNKVAKDLVRDYNQTNSADADEKERILNELLGGKGKNLWITAPFYVDYGNNIYFGNNCEVNMNCTFLDDNIIRIGDNALIAPNVQIYTAFHPTNAIDRFGIPKEDGSFEFCKTQTAPVIIGNNVWIGGGAIILPGVTIGNNVVIGAGSVVTKNIPDNVIAVGSPCRVVRRNQ